MAFDQLELLSGWLAFLHGHAVLQVSHANVHGQRRVAHGDDMVLVPLEHFTCRQAAHGAHQHGVGGAVTADFAACEMDQRKQRAVRIALQLTVQLFLQAIQPRQKTVATEIAQHAVDLGLQVDPVRLVTGLGACGLFVVVRRYLHLGNLAQLMVLHDRLVQAVEITTPVVLGLVGVNIDLAAPPDHGLQVLSTLHLKTLAGQQHATDVPQCTGQRLTNHDGVDTDGNKIHG